MPLDRDDQYDEQKQAQRWVAVTILIAFLILFSSMLLARPAGYYMQYGISQKTTAGVKTYFSKIYKSSGGYLFTSYQKWIKEIIYQRGSVPPALWFPVIPFPLFVFAFLLGLKLNPYTFLSLVKGSGHFAREDEIKKMGLFDGWIFVLGRFKGKFLRLKETLSVLACAPPGTGKTAAIVVPTVLECDTVSMIVNDPKPEICYKTSGYRATLGSVFIINWGAEDDPNEGLFWPSWNPLAANAVPRLGPERDMYVDSMVSILVEEPEGSAADPHWSKTGRNALAGFVHFIVSKCERARANDYFKGRLEEGSFDDEDACLLEGYYVDMQDISAATALQKLREGTLDAASYVAVGTWDRIPKAWIGHEACISMILDWISESQIQVAEDIKRRKQQGDQMAALADPMREMLETAVSEARKFGYAHRAILEFTQLAGTPDKERGSILSTALTGIGIFKNSAVRARTSHSDFTFRDLRGMVDPATNKMCPTTVYLSINQVDARALNIISGTFIELMSNFLIANAPNMEHKGKKVGPFPVLFVLDEFPTMPKLDAVITGPSVGRGMQVSYLLIGQDLGQISGSYGEPALETIMSTTAAKIVLAQNNEKTAQRFSEMLSSRTIEVKSYSESGGILGLFAKKSYSTSLDSDPVVGKGMLMGLKPDKQVVILQQNTKTPIIAESPRYYLDKKMMAKVNIPSAPPVPYWIIARRGSVSVPQIGGGAPLAGQSFSTHQQMPKKG